MIKQKKNSIEIDVLGSIEFDLTEAIKDLFYHIKSIKSEIEAIKKEFNEK